LDRLPSTDLTELAMVFKPVAIGLLGFGWNGWVADEVDGPDDVSNVGRNGSVLMLNFGSGFVPLGGVLSDARGDCVACVATVSG
jgi:hypothetical protein